MCALEKPNRVGETRVDTSWDPNRLRRDGICGLEQPNRVGETRFQDRKQLFRVGETRFLFYENANRVGETRFISKACATGSRLLPISSIKLQTV